MTDIVAELRRLYEAAPQGQWTLKPFVDLRGRVIGYDIRTGPRRRDVIEVATSELCDLIVAMHEALPALLDVVEALQRYVRHFEAPRAIDDETALNAWDRQVGQNWDAIEDALVALKRSDDE